MKIGTPGFVGERLLEARESRGFTANALATAIGVSAAAVSQYEKEVQTPRPEVMERICAVLNFPQHFFTTKPDREAGIVFWRSLVSATKSSRVAAERRLGWVQDLHSALCDTVEFPQLVLPDLDLPKEPTAITETEIERAAADARAFWRVPDGPLENVSHLVESHGVVLARENLESTTLDALVKWCESGKAYCLVSSGKQAAVRARLNLLHELGHLVLHRNLSRWHLLNRELHPILEAQAFQFAGAFGLPSAEFAADLYSFALDGFLEAKSRWKFSVQAMIKRCETLGILREDTAQRLWRSAAARGWKIEEPLDDEIPQEHPSMLAEGIGVALADGPRAKDALVYRMAIPAADIESLAALAVGTLAELRNVSVMPLALGTQSNKTISTGPKIVAFPKQR